MTVQAQQVYGGHGYIEKWGHVGNTLRDARIGDDLRRRQTACRRWIWSAASWRKDGGKHVMAFFDMVKKLLQGPGRDRRHGRIRRAAETRLQGSAGGRHVLHVRGMKTPNAALAGSYDFHASVRPCLPGLMWARMAEAALAAMAAGTDDPGVPRDEARHRAVLHGPPAADDRDPSGAHPVRRRTGDGARRGETSSLAPPTNRAAACAEQAPPPTKGGRHAQAPAAHPPPPTSR